MSAQDTDKILNGPLKSASASPIKGKLSTQILVVLALLVAWGVGGYLVWGIANEGRTAARKGTVERPLLRADIDKLIAGRVSDTRKLAQLAKRQAAANAIRSKQNQGDIREITKVIEGSPGAPGAIGLGRQGEPGVGFAGPIGPIGFGTPGERGEPGVGEPGRDGQDGQDGESITGPKGEDGPPPTDAQVQAAVDAFLLSHTLTCEPTTDPLDSPERQTCTFDP